MERGSSTRQLLCTMVFLLMFGNPSNYFGIRGAAAFRVGMLPRTRPHGRMRLFSTKTKSAATAATTTNHNHVTMPTVLLKRNRQSKMFRMGNPLVFTKAIESTTTSKHTKNNNEIAAGQLVHVVVAADTGKGSKKQQSKGAKTDSGSPVSAAPQPKRSAPTVSLGYGVYNPHSMYKVRFLCNKLLHPALFRTIQDLDKNDSDNAEHRAVQCILEHHVRTAQQARAVLGLPTPSSSTDAATDAAEITDTYRLIHGEGDGLSGLAVDVIGGNTIVVMSSAAWCQIHQTTIVRVLEQVLPDDCTIVWKTTPARLAQDGWEAEETDAIPNDDDDDDDATPKEEGNPVVVSRENGIVFFTHPFQTGQKTGVYCDQRETRRWLAQYCNHKRVLDLCCYHGGFSLNAAVHGNARWVTGVDSSADAVAACQINAAENDVADRTEFVRSDITQFLQHQSFDDADDSSYDVVILDPPKLAPSVSALPRARRKYHGLNRDALRAISNSRGGLLLSCTCSAAMTQSNGNNNNDFLSMVHGAALAAGRTVTLLSVRGAAACHTQSPSAWPAGAYLTAALFHVHPANINNNNINYGNAANTDDDDDDDDTDQGVNLTAVHLP